jgi:hypothetical protein
VAINLIVLAVTVLMVGFLAVWISFPGLRTWMEVPKYRFLERQSRFPGVRHARQPGTAEPSRQEDRPVN